MAKPKSAASILKNLKKQRFEPKTPIATEMYIPNHSGDLSAGKVNTTPTTDYQPVNKKYVDDEIAAIPVITDYWKTTTAQTELTGDKTGSFDLTTTGDINADIGIFGSAGRYIKIYPKGIANPTIEPDGTDPHQNILIYGKGLGGVQLIVGMVGSHISDMDNPSNQFNFIPATGKIKHSSGTLDFDNEHLTTTGNITGATLNAGDGFTGTGAYTNFTIVNGIITAAS